MRRIDVFPRSWGIESYLVGLRERIDEEIGQRFFARPEARILTSLPGMGPTLGAEFLVAVGDIRTFESADRLAA